MTSGLTSRLIHRCNINRLIQDQRLNFKTGSKTFTAYKFVTGKTSGASGIISYFTLSSGSWDLGTATGYMVISGVSGTFLPGETLTDDGTIPGAAILDTVIPETNEVGKPVITVLTSGCTKCRFVFGSAQGMGTGITSKTEGQLILKIPMVFFASDVNVLEGDLIRTNEAGWAGKTFKVINVDQIYEFRSSTIDHIEASLQSLDKGAV